MLWSSLFYIRFFLEWLGLFRFIQLLLVYLSLSAVVFNVKIDNVGRWDYTITLNKFYIVNNEHTLSKFRKYIGDNFETVSFSYKNNHIVIYINECAIYVNKHRQDIELGDISLSGILLVHAMRD